MERQGRKDAQISSHSIPAKSPKIRKFVAKISDSDDEEDKMPPSSKFKNLKSSIPLLSSDDQGQVMLMLQLRKSQWSRKEN